MSFSKEEAQAILNNVHLTFAEAASNPHLFKGMCKLVDIIESETSGTVRTVSFTAAQSGVINAIKFVRAITGISLKDAKDVVDAAKGQQQMAGRSDDFTCLANTTMTDKEVFAAASGASIALAGITIFLP